MDIKSYVPSILVTVNTHLSLFILILPIPNFYWMYFNTLKSSLCNSILKTKVIFSIPLFVFNTGNIQKLHSVSVNPTNHL